MDHCFDSILAQTALRKVPFEICVCDDASTDRTKELLNRWKPRFIDKNVELNVFCNDLNAPKGGKLHIYLN